MTSVARQERQLCAVHVDLDGAADIYRAHGWPYPFTDDPAWVSGLLAFLDLFQRLGIRATLFVITNALDDARKLELLREAVRRGHEIASHTRTHANLDRLDRAEQRSELQRSRDDLAEALGVEVRGFRAPGYRVNRATLQVLAELGYAWDSSVHPTPHFARRLGVDLAHLRRGPIRFGSALVELPLPDHRPLPTPFSPSYSLLFGHWYFRTGLRRFARAGLPLVLLFHLIDLADPLPKERIAGLSPRVMTLSLMNARRKRAACERMLNEVAGRFEIRDSSALVAAAGNGPDVRMPEDPWLART
jgi:hypothetical protein